MARALIAGAKIRVRQPTERTVPRQAHGTGALRLQSSSDAQGPARKRSFRPAAKETLEADPPIGDINRVGAR